MREKKNYAVLTFRTTAEAMAFETRCMETGMPGRMIPVPREITAGCGLAWRMAAEDYTEQKDRLRALGLMFDRAVELML